MDDKIFRNISTDVLNRVKDKLNHDFVSELPASPEELLSFAKRRVDPVISDNITYALGQSMLSHRLSDEDYLLTFFNVVHSSFYGKSKSQSQKVASIIISQTGAGKTNLRNLILANNDSIVINPDLCKKFRPDAKQIFQEDPTHFGALTGIDSYDHSSNISALAANKGYNLLFECAPSEKQGLVGIDVERLENDGYKIEAKILAVGDLISSIAIHDRYEENPEAPGAKLTDLNRHDESYRATSSVIRELDKRNIQIYRRGLKKENYVPQELTKQDLEYTVEDFMKMLAQERRKSNHNYVFDNTGKNFQEDFNRIKSHILQRNAPDAQLSQLNLIYDKYISYLNFIKYQEESEGIEL